MKTSNFNSKEAKVKLTLEDFNLDKIENLTAIAGGNRTVGECPTESTCTCGDDGCCDDVSYDDSYDPSGNQPCID